MRGIGKKIHSLEKTGELWLGSLSHFRSAYGRLVYLAGLRNPDTGRYEHYGLESAESAAETSLALKRTHELFFREWVSFSLERKMQDVNSYISAIQQVNSSELIDAWLRLTPYKNLVPLSIQGPERAKHISDFEVILGLLKNTYGVSDPGQDA